MYLLNGKTYTKENVCKGIEKELLNLSNEIQLLINDVSWQIHDLLLQCKELYSPDASQIPAHFPPEMKKIFKELKANLNHNILLTKVGKGITNNELINKEKSAQVTR